MGLLGNRRQFRDVVSRQLRLFAQEHGDVAEQARRALAAYDAEADPHAAVDSYAAYEDLSEDVEEHLYDMCDAFALSLEGASERRYRREFDRQAKRTYGDVIPRLNVLQPRRSDDGVED